MGSEVFRFMTVRPPQRVDHQELERYIVRVDEFAGPVPENDGGPLFNCSQLYADLRKHRQKGDRSGMVEVAKQFLGISHFNLDRLDRLTFKSIQDPPSIIDLDRWISGQKKPIMFSDLRQAVQIIFGTSPAEIVSSDGYRQARRSISCFLTVLSIYPNGYMNIRVPAVRFIRIMGLLERMADPKDNTLETEGAIEKALRAHVILPADIFPLPPAQSEAQTLGSSRQQENSQLRKKSLQHSRELAERLQKLKNAKDELEKAVTADGIEKRRQEAESSKLQQDSGHEKEGKGGGAEVSGLSQPYATNPTPILMDNDNDDIEYTVETPQKQGFKLSQQTVEGLSNDTHTILTELSIPTDYIDVPMATSAISKELADVTSKLYVPQPSQQLVRIGNTYLPMDTFLPFSSLPSPYQPLNLIDGKRKPPCITTWAPGPCPALETPEKLPSDSLSIPNNVGLVRPMGVTDLMLVEQEIQKYVLGEVAHIENVLKGEFKERIHRRAKTTEETFFQETETTETAERDLETTERFELQLESQRVINEETRKEAGVTVTAKYGTVAGSVEATAYGNYASNRAKEQSKRSAQSYSRDVTERSVSRIQERVLERRSRRTVQEVEETNTHRLKNDVDPDGHIVGLYRWVDKLYKAQMLNYGKRMTFDIIVPEPAAFFRYAESTNPLEGTTITKPDPPGYCVRTHGLPSCAGTQFCPLTPEDITPEKYLFWVGKYEVPNAEPPPSQYKVIGKAFDQPSVADPPDNIKIAKDELQVPPGYVAKKAWINGAHVKRGSGNLYMKVSIGRRRTRLDIPAQRDALLDDEDEIIPIAVVGDLVAAYAFNIEVCCERTKEAYQQWQMDTYTAIMTAYNEKKAAYDEQIAAAEIEEGIAIQGRNPLRNREIERTELKKAAISGISGQHFDLFDAMRNSSSQGYPQMDFAEAEAEGRYIQFFEQAFDWENMTYLFYPYIWGRKDEWPAISSLDDVDPLFAQFLRAGAAKVKVPVNIGYEEAVCHFIETGGDIWIEDDPPHIEDEFCLSIVEEMRQEEKNQLDENKGSLIVEQGNPVVRGVNTEFTEDDIDREITIVGKKYRIADVISQINSNTSSVLPGDKMDELTLTESYQGESQENVRYSLGVKFVGEPWEVKVPTSLVFLQQEMDKLPDWTDL